jgi:hypothetical protein
MVEIKNWKVYDLKESVIACRNAMRLDMPEYTAEEFEKALPRAIKLAKCGGGSGHSNFRKGIRVSFDLKYPNYFSPELQRYGFLDIVCSMSKMHKLINMDMDLVFNKYVSQRSVDNMKYFVAEYNRVSHNQNEQHTFYFRDGSIVTATGKDAVYIAFMNCISECPQGIELFMRCSTNYEQLATIYRQRKTHRLKEDWIEGFCQNFIEKLPYFNELISGDYGK